jgi:RNA polymerase sigma factor (TIGR02999 family)
MQNVTQMLEAARNGESTSLNQLLPIVYEELRRLAHRQLKREKSDLTLNTTGLVHEAYLRLIRQPQMEAQNRQHFFAIAAQLMRQILIDHARMRHAQKRGGTNEDVRLDDVMLWLTDSESEQLLDLDEALERLKLINERAYQVVVYRFFAGLNYDEIADVMDLTNITVRRAWTTAKMWLNRELAQADRTLSHLD